MLHTIAPLVQTTYITQLTNLVWITVGILQQQSVALPQIAQSIPGDTQAESRVTQIRRWLKNIHVDVWAFYHPMLEHTLRGWQKQDVTIIVDGVMVFGDRLQIFRLSLVHGCRAIPIVWKVVVGKGLTTVDCLDPMLTQAAEFLRPRVKSVTLLADRGFRDWDWAALCEKLGWDYLIRIPCNTTVTLGSGVQCRIDELGVKRGQRRYFQQVRVTLEHQGLTHLSVTWTEGEAQNPPEILAVMSRRPASKARLRRYGWRMRIEQSFRDDKSGGFDLAHTRLRHPERLERLLLAVAMATIWWHELGEKCLKGGDRRQIDPGWERELSLFQLGLRWLHRCLATALESIPVFLARLTPIRLAPVVKSGFP
jgi:hypothetical protein